MTIKRRLEKLEAVLPENTQSYRLVFTNSWEPSPPAIDHGDNKVMVVRFVDTPSSRAKRLLAAPFAH